MEPTEYVLKGTKCTAGKEGWIPRKGKDVLHVCVLERKDGYLVRERMFCLPGKGVRGCVCTGKEGWIPRKGKGVLFIM